MTDRPPRDARQHSAAAARNKQPILEVLQRVLPVRGTALEIAAGCGQHAAHFCAHLPQWTWLPTDADADALASIAAWRAQANVPNLLPPRRLDVLAADWADVPSVDAIFCANLLHIAPWRACPALMRGAARHLAPEGWLIIYGPFLVDGEATAPSNVAFDADLHERNPEWGLRRLADVVAEAEKVRIALRERVAMPANNQTLVFQRAG